MPDATSFARLIDAISYVDNSAVRDALFPNPAVNQRVQNLSTGYVERWDGVQWVQEAPTNSAGPVISVRAKGAKGNGTDDDSAAFVLAEAARAASGGVLYVPPGTYKIASQVVSTTAVGHVHWVFAPGAIVQCYVPDAIKWVCTTSVAGLLVENAEFHNYHGVAKRACVRVTVSGTGAWERVRMPGLRINGRNAFVRGEGIWIETAFEGEVDLWCESGPELGMRINALGVNSGNFTIRYASNFASIGVWLNYGAGNTLLNNIRFPNFKVVCDHSTAKFAETTATGAHVVGATTLIVGSTTGFAANDYVVIAGKQYVRVQSVTDATHLALTDALEYALAGGEHVVASQFGLVAQGTNVEIVSMHSSHFEGMGVGIYSHGAKLIRASGVMLGGQVKRGLLCHAGALGCELSNVRLDGTDNNLVVVRTADSGTQFNGLADYVAVDGGTGGTAILLSDTVADGTNFVRRAAHEFGANVVINSTAFGFAWRDGSGTLHFLGTSDGTHTHLRSYTAIAGSRIKFEDASGTSRGQYEADTGDIDFAGGYRQPLYGWAQPTTVAGTQTDVVLTDTVATRGRTMARAGSITGVAVRLTNVWTAGTLTIKVQKSTDSGATWATVAGPQVAISSAVKSAQATFAKNTYPFSAGDMLRLTITTAGFTPTANDCDAALEVET